MSLDCSFILPSMLNYKITRILLRQIYMREPIACTVIAVFLHSRFLIIDRRSDVGNIYSSASERSLNNLLKMNDTVVMQSLYHEIIAVVAIFLIVLLKYIQLY
jgi:hypothetical protein